MQLAGIQTWSLLSGPGKKHTGVTDWVLKFELQPMKKG